MFNLADFRYCIGNPSAWDHYDDGMSERMRSAAAEIEQLHLDYQRICRGHDQLHDERDDARAEIERLRAAIKPFALAARGQRFFPNADEWQQASAVYTNTEPSTGEQAAPGKEP